MVQGSCPGGSHYKDPSGSRIEKAPCALVGFRLAPDDVSRLFSVEQYWDAERVAPFGAHKPWELSSGPAFSNVETSGSRPGEAS